MRKSIVVMAAAVLAVGWAAAGRAQVIERVSVADDGAEANGESIIVGGRSAMSADGRYVVFESGATNLVADDFNGWTDVFVRDRQLQTTTRVSVNLDGGDANGPSEIGSISADGRYVAFRSAASDLVDGDTNWEWDIFVRDTLLGVTIRVSVSVDGGDANDDSTLPSISAEGRYVAFLSSAFNLVQEPNNRLNSAYLRDLLLGETVLASGAWDGGAADWSVRAPTISGNGRHMSFATEATNIVPDDFNGLVDVFHRDLDTGVTLRASVDVFGGDPDGRSVGPSLNHDGTHVAFTSIATDLVSGDANGEDDIFVRFLPPPPSTGLVSLSSDGQQGDLGSSGPYISAGARYVAFGSIATNLVPGDTNAWSDVFLHDRYTGRTWRVSTDLFGNEANEWSGVPSISSDDRFVVFRSGASNLVPEDTNGVGDVFVAYGPATLLADGFESGDLSAWSSIVP
jgi:Tol biopolymer transport system component